MANDIQFDRDATIDYHFTHLDAKHAKPVLSLMLERAVLPNSATMHFHDNLWNLVHSKNHMDINNLVTQ